MKLPARLLFLAGGMDLMRNGLGGAAGNLPGGLLQDTFGLSR